MTNDRDEFQWLVISSDPLPVDEAIAFVQDTKAGGIAVFLGTTRDETSDDGRKLAALDYEAYEDMAAAQLRDLAASARYQWPVIRISILHRTGRVEPSQPSVIIAVSTPHRADAFDACRWLIDSLKKDVAIWKKEIWADGSTSWVDPHVDESE